MLSAGIDKLASEDGGGPSLLFHVIEGGFHETHPIHHPIQVFEIIDLGQGRSVSVMLGGGGYGLDPFDPQDVISFLDQIVQVDARVRQRHGTQPHLPLPPGQMEGGRQSYLERIGLILRKFASVGMTGERHVEGHLVVYGSVSLLGNGGCFTLF